MTNPNTQRRSVRVIALILVAMLVVGLGGALLANALSNDNSAQADSPSTDHAPVVPDSTASTTPSPDLDAAVSIAVRYTEAVREHNAGAIWDIGSAEVRETERETFIEGYSFTGVTDARVSGVGEVGWDSSGQRMAIVPVIVTVAGAPQIGRILVVKENGEWRFYDAVSFEQTPALTQERPKQQ